MTDRWLGRLLQRMDDFNLWDDTAVILTTDHGHFLGDHGWVGKPACPLYQTIAHIPLFVHLPGGKRAGERIDALSTTVDLYPTILDWFGVTPPRPVHGRSLLPVLDGRADQVRDHVLYGYWGRGVNYTDGRHTYLRRPQAPGNVPLEMYSLRWSMAPWCELPDLTGRLELGPFMPQTDMPVGRLPFRPHERRANPDKIVESPLLFDVRDDESQEHDLAGTAIETTCENKLREALHEIQAPPSQFQGLGL